MASRRRPAAAARTEKPPLTSPARRSSRRRAAEGARDGGSPGGGGRAEGDASAQPLVSHREVCETPKRTLRKTTRSPKVNSPVTETDILQEIFWDPHSPVARKRGNGQKKQTTNGCTVEISEIVNRIAPQDEKPGSNKGTLLGLWIGDDAIPCTPGIAKVRSRTKVNGARGRQLKNKEEELMKLAKQFDKNFTDAIQDQDALCHNIHIPSDAEISVLQQRDSEVKNQQFLEQRLHTVTAMPVGAIKENTRTVEHSENRNEMSIDLAAEVALNALFDGPTQKCSGHLSQGLSDCSPAKSSHGSPSTLLEEERAVEKTGTSGETQRQSSTCALQIVEPLPAENTKVTSKQAIPSIVTCKEESVASDKLATVGDDFDDWSADLLPDESFLININQNPEVMSIVENVLPHMSNANNETKVKTFNSDKSKSPQSAFSKSSNSVPALHSLEEQSNRIGKIKPVFWQGGCHSKINERDSVSKSTRNKISGCSSVPVKPESKGTEEGFTQLKCIASTAFPAKNAATVTVHSTLPQFQTGKYRSTMHSSSHQSPTIPASAKPHNLQKPTTQGHLNQAETAKKHVSSFDDWNELRFSDDVLNSFCESDSLWGSNCNEDDDLLYRVCDDIEKRTLSQAVATENGKAKSLAASASESEVGPCLVVPKQGLSSFPQVPRSHTGRKTFSLDVPTTATQLKNKDSACTSLQRSCAPFQNEMNSVAGKWHRSLSVPEGGFASGVGLASVSDSGTNCSNLGTSYFRQNTNSSTQWQKGFCNTGKVQKNSSISQMLTDKSKYVFRKTSNSQALVLNDKSSNIGSLPVTHLGLGESKNPPNVPLHTTVQMNTKPVFKRHLSDCFVHSETEQKSRKCSQEEIAKKKQEALQRRKFKMQGLQKNPTPT